MELPLSRDVTPGLKGFLSRWLIEPAPGVFVGRPSALVRDKLWDLACSKARGGEVMMAYSDNSEQGFSIKMQGITSRKIIDIEGLFLVETA